MIATPNLIHAAREQCALIFFIRCIRCFRTIKRVSNIFQQYETSITHYHCIRVIHETSRHRFIFVNLSNAWTRWRQNARVVWKLVRFVRVEGDTWHLMSGYQWNCLFSRREYTLWDVSLKIVWNSLRVKRILYIDGTPCEKTRDNRCLLPFDKSVPWTDSEFAITINSSVHVILFVSYIMTVLHLKCYICANKYRVWLPRYLPLDNLNVQPFLKK